jgi:hypothetical protein
VLPPLAVTAEQLAKDFQADEKAAGGTYRDRWLLVEGPYKEAYERSIAGNVTRMVYFKDYRDPVKGHTCAVGWQVPEGSWPRVDGLTPGQKVKVRARCLRAGYLSVLLGEGEVLEVGPDPAVVVPAAQLAREFAANREAAREKYNDKWLLVEGTVEETSKDKPTVTLAGPEEKGAKPVRVVARFGGDREADPGKVKKGDKVRLKGKASLYLDDGSAVLEDCKLVK